MEKSKNNPIGIRVNEKKLELAKKQTGQPTLQKVVNFLLDSIWYQHNPLPKIEIGKGVLPQAEKPPPFKPNLTVADVKEWGESFEEKIQIEKTESSTAPKNWFSEFSESLKYTESYKEVVEILTKAKECVFLLEKEKKMLNDLGNQIIRDKGFYND